MNLKCAFLLVFAAVIGQVACGGGKGAAKLYTKLFRDYNKEIRPVEEVTDTVNVQFAVLLIEVIELDNSGHSTLNTWLRMTWKDSNLRWNAKDFGGVNQLHLPAKDVWLPDVVLFNSAEEDINKERNVIVYSDGTIVWVTPAVFKVSCRHEFRGNAWTCPLKFGSWTFTEAQMNLTGFDGTPVDIDISEYLSGDQFAILETKGQRRERKYDGVPDVYPTMEYMLKVRAKIGTSLLLGKK